MPIASGADVTPTPPDQADMLALALEAGGIGTLDVDLRTRVARRGGIGAATFGLMGQEPLSHDEWLNLLHPGDRDIVSAAFETMLRTGARYDVEYRIRRKTDGALRWVNVRAQPLRDAGGTLCRLVGVVRDVTAQKQAEAALRESEARLRLAQRAARLGSFDWRVNEPSATVSEEYGTIHGLPPGTTEDSYEAWLRRVHPDDRARVALDVDAMLRGAPYASEYRIIREHDSAVRWLLSRAEIFDDHDGKAMRVIGAVRDVTEHRAIEAQLRALNEDLERRVQDEVAAREAAQLKLAQAQRLEALGQLAGGIAHDFNNVLQSMQGAAALIERRPGDTESVRRLARMALEAAARGASVTRRLLAFSRQGDLRAEAIEPDALLHNLRDLLAHVLGAGITIQLDIAPGLPALHADKGQLETVLVNLATNARDAMEHGGILTLAADLIEITADGEPALAPRLSPGAYIRILVGDTGTGMDAATLARASEPFFTTKPLHKGTGLGLAMARGFAEQSGGALLIESAERRGTSVALWLPVAAAVHDPANKPEPASRRKSVPAERRRILVIDDEEAVRDTIARQLEADGYVVTSLRDGMLALEQVATGASFDCVVCDLSMPGLGGIEVIRSLHRLRPGLPAILLTGYAGDEAALASAANIEGTLNLLRKPISAQILADHIARLLLARE